MRANINGLTETQVIENRKKFGANELRAEKKQSGIAIFLSQFNDLMIYMLGVATIASAFMGEYVEAITITIIILLNGILGFIQEYRTSKTLEQLKKMAAPNTNVLRNGMLSTIPSAEVVVGDVIVFEAGEKVAADMKILEEYGVQVDESLLTGESMPVHKKVNDTANMGTIITNGRGIGEVLAVGMNTQMGQIANMLKSNEKILTPIQIMLEKLGKIIVVACVLICMAVVGLGIFRGENWLDMILSGISLAVAAVPEGMPAIVTVALAIGVRRMLAKNVLVRRLPAVETLGCSTVICSDKTGTITQNRMSVRELYGKKVPLKLDRRDAGAIELLEMAFKCSTIQIVKSRKGKITKCVDPTEQAILEAAEKLHIDTMEVYNKRNLLYEIPFNSNDKRMVVVLKMPNGAAMVVVKGAPDEVFKCCNNMSPQYAKEQEKMTNNALRVIGVAYKYIEKWTYNIPSIEQEEKKFELFKSELVKDLTYMGLIGIIDPPKREVKAAVRKCKSAGVRTIMITGDHKNTAAAIAREVGILDKQSEKAEAITGAELDKMSSEEFSRSVGEANVFARVSPRHKYAIVQELQRQGNVVAMTGDGVNDAPAVGVADIGVAMGKYGTDVTREAAAMVLLDDNFASITEAIVQGRVIFGNIRKFIRYLLACNIGEVLTMFLTMLLGMPLPLLPIHILFVNLVTDGLPALALGCEPADPDVMTRPPRKKQDGVFSNGLGWLIVTRGILIGLCTVGVFAYAYYVVGDLSLARTSAFVMLIFSQLMHVFECKSEQKSLFKINIFNNIQLILAAVLSLGLTIAVTCLPFGNEIFETVPLSEDMWKIVCATTLALPIIGVMLHRVKRLFGGRRS